MHLSTPALFAPYVRLELLHWDPLYADGDVPSGPPPSTEGGTAGLGAPAASFQAREGVHQGFDRQQWYEALFDYGMGGDTSTAAAANEDDPDMELVPQLVRKLVLPIALGMIERSVGRSWWKPARCP